MKIINALLNCFKNQQKLIEINEVVNTVNQLDGRGRFKGFSIQKIQLVSGNKLTGYTSQKTGIEKTSKIQLLFPESGVICKCHNDNQ
jgi:biotin synthase-related radical SAM superfamily protein